MQSCGRSEASARECDGVVDDVVAAKTSVTHAAAAAAVAASISRLSSPPGENEVFEVNTTNEIDWDELRRVGTEFEHENIVMLGSKALSRAFFPSSHPPSHPWQDTRSTFEKPPDALLVATLPGEGAMQILYFLSLSLY